MTHEQMETEVLRLRRTVGTLIGWITQSAAAPLTVKEAERLWQMLEGDLTQKEVSR